MVMCAAKAAPSWCCGGSRDAVADGDRILAVVRGSAVNQDGRSGGLTAPNGPAQEAVIRAALAAAGVAPAAVGYIEAHGTGTPLGDPIEVGALGAVFGPGRAARQPLAIGSVEDEHRPSRSRSRRRRRYQGRCWRCNAARYRRTCISTTANPHIDWAALPVTVPVETVPWHGVDGRRLAGVSSFGFSGCNAHVDFGGGTTGPGRFP